MAKDKKDTYQNIRLPLVGSYFHRTDDIEQYLTDGKDQQFVNCYFDAIINPITQTPTIKVKKRPGFVNYNTSDYESASVTSNGILSAALWRFGDTLSVCSIWKTGTNSGAIIATTFGTLGTVSVTNIESASAITSCLSGSTPAIIFHIYGGAGTTRKAYFYADGSGSLTEITDAQFPDATMTGNFVFVDGYAFIMTEEGAIYNSDLNSLSSWTSTSLINSSVRPDAGVSLARYKDKIVAFNSTSIEFFELNPNPPTVGSVLQRVNHLAIKDIGLYQGRSTTENTGINNPYAQTNVIEYEDTVYWLTGYNLTSQTSLYTLENYQPKKLSDLPTEALLGFGYMLSGIINWLGDVYIVLYNSTSSKFFFFSLRTKTWTRWDLGFTTGTFCPILNHGSSIVLFRGTDYYNIGFKNSDSSAASLVYADDGNAYTMKIQTSRVDLGTNKRKRLHKLDVIGDKQGTANTLSINWSDDDYTNFNTARTVAMGDNRSYLNNCGIFRRRAFKLEHSANTACELEAIELQLSMMES